LRRAGDVSAHKLDVGSKLPRSKSAWDGADMECESLLSLSRRRLAASNRRGRDRDRRDSSMRGAFGSKLPHPKREQARALHIRASDTEFDRPMEAHASAVCCAAVVMSGPSRSIFELPFQSIRNASVVGCLSASNCA